MLLEIVLKHSTLLDVFGYFVQLVLLFECVFFSIYYEKNTTLLSFS